MKRFYRKKGVAGELLAKERTKLFLDEDIFFMEEGTGKGVIMQITSSFGMGWDGEAQVTDASLMLTRKSQSG